MGTALGAYPPAQDAGPLHGARVPDRAGQGAGQRILGQPLAAQRGGAGPGGVALGPGLSGGEILDLPG